MGIIKYKDIAYGGGSSVVEGYYKIADGKFYEHFDGTTYSDEITGQDGILYVDLSTNNLYRWSTGASLFVLVGRYALASLSDVDAISPSNENALEYNLSRSKWVAVPKKADDAVSNQTITYDSITHMAVITSDTGTKPIADKLQNVFNTLASATSGHALLIDDKADNTQTTITEAQTRTNLADGDTVPTIFGKIKKWFTDLKDLAFIGKDGTTSTKYLRGDGTWQNFPTIPAAQIQSDWNQSDNTKVDFIKNKPTIPAAQVNSDWNASSGVAEILNKPTIPDDTKVKQTNTTSSTVRSLLLASNNSTSEATAQAYKDSNLKYKPSTKTLTVANLEGTASLAKKVYYEGNSGGAYVSGEASVNTELSNSNTVVPTGKAVVDYTKSNYGLNNFATSGYIDISGYTSNLYTTPSDGYVQFNGSNVLIEIHSADTSNNQYTYALTNSNSGTHCVFVRKGMRLKVVGTVTTARFYKLDSAS